MHRSGRVLLVVVATLVVAVGGAPAWRAATGSQGAGGDASCAYVVEYAGRTWSPAGSERQVAPGAVLGAGVLPGCDDGNGATEPETVEVRRIDRVDPAVAVQVDGQVLVPWGEPLPEALREAASRPTCDLEGPTALAGRWLGVRSSREVRFDGDVRGPYRIDFETSDPRVTGGFATAVLTARGTTASVPITPDDVRRLLWRDAPSVLLTHCDGDRFVVESLRPAG